MAPILVHEDVFLRGKKMFEQKIVVPPGKGELTAQELCIAPSAHTDPQLKPAIQYYSQGAIVRLSDPKGLEPSRRLCSSNPLGPNVVGTERVGRTTQ